MPITNTPGLDSKSMPTISWNDLQLGELIGNGSFGDVYQGKWQGKDVAIKLLQVKVLNPSMKKAFMKEAELMLQINSQNTLTLYGVCLEPGHSAMIMEYMHNGCLLNLLQDLDQEIEQLRWQIAIDIAQGLPDLHQGNIVHRDLKSTNILLDSNYTAKIADFGLSQLRLDTSTMHTAKSSGSLRWAAPEIRQPEFYRLTGEAKTKALKAADLYSYGMIVLELVTRSLPYGDAPDEVITAWIKDGIKPEIPVDCPPAFRQIIEACWQPNLNRPPAEQIVTQLEVARPQRLITEQQIKPWHIDPTIKPLPNQQIPNYVRLPATGLDFQKVLECYDHHPVPGYTVGSVEVIYSPKMNRAFELKMALLQERAGNPKFAPHWQYDGEQPFRNKVNSEWLNLASKYQDHDYPNIKLMQLWHGTNHDALDSIFRSGYANLATTDEGFFGKGIYGSHEAEYAYRVYSNGALILNWVATFSAYPVIFGDMEKLAAKGNFGNYDAHFAFVAPKNPHDPNEAVYYPCTPNQQHKYTEVVVFNEQQCLPRYLVTLQAELVKPMPVLPNPILEQIQKQKEKLQITENQAREQLTLTHNQQNQELFNQFKTAHILYQKITNEQKQLVITEKEIRSKLQTEENPPRIAIFNQFQAGRETLRQNMPTCEKLTQFLHHIGYGEQDEAEAMLKSQPNLALQKGELIDCAGRKFQGITGFQYAMWALDWYMRKMVHKYMPREAIKEQINTLNTGSWVKKHGKTVSWQPLITALKTLNDNWQQWSCEQINEHWCQQVGGAQLYLPAHLINEYMRKDLPFYNQRKFAETEGLPRVGVNIWRSPGVEVVKTEWTLDRKQGSLGHNFAWTGAGEALRALERGNGVYAKYGVAGPCANLSQLYELRSKQLTELFQNYNAQRPQYHCG